MSAASMCEVNALEVQCPYRHEMPITGDLAKQNFKDCYYGVNDPVAVKLLNKAGEMSSPAPPDDKSIMTLYVGGLGARVTEEDLKDHFYAHGEIESIRLITQRACAFVTYTAREGAEKAAEELSNKLVIKGLWLKLLWGKAQARITEVKGPTLAPAERAFYPSMDPQRMGTLALNQEAGQSNAGAEKQLPPPPPPAFQCGQFPRLHPAYEYQLFPAYSGQQLCTTNAAGPSSQS